MVFPTTILLASIYKQFTSWMWSCIVCNSQTVDFSKIN